jgi:hypothetical protein
MEEPINNLEPDHPRVRECQAETTGDEISKADYQEMLLREMYGGYDD